MLEKLNQIDRALFLAINGAHNDSLDKVMWFASEKLTWLPLYLFLAYLIFRKFGKEKFLYFVSVCFLMILASDTLSSMVVKPATERLRPSHTPGLMELVHTVNDYHGGLYGFVSSHAANSFALAFFCILLFNKQWLTWLLLSYALLVSYSRIYLGVHYPGDVAGGSIIGSAIGCFAFFIVNKWIIKKVVNSH